MPFWWVMIHPKPLKYPHKDTPMKLPLAKFLAATAVLGAMQMAFGSTLGGATAD